MNKFLIILLLSLNIFIYSDSAKTDMSLEEYNKEQAELIGSWFKHCNQKNDLEKMRQKIVIHLNEMKQSGKNVSDSDLDYGYQTALEFLKKNSNTYSSNYQNNKDKVSIIKEENLLNKIKFWKKSEQKIKYQFKNISAIIPEQLYLIIDSLKNNAMLLPRFILHGAPGNGKSTLMQEIALELDAEFIEVHAPSLVTKFQGSGAENIKNYFYNAIDCLLENKKVVLFFDEIDAICPKDNNTHQDLTSTLQNLWLWLDRVKYIPGIYTVFATNNFDKLNNAFISRFDSNIIEIKNPCEYARKDIIEHYFKKFNGNLNQNIEYNQNSINKIAKKSDGLNSRSIEGIVRLICQKAIKDSGKIDLRNIDELIAIQNKHYVTEKKEENKNEIKRTKLEITQNVLTCTGAVIGILTGCYVLHKYYKTYKAEKEFWDTGESWASWIGLKDEVSFVRKHEESLSKLNSYFSGFTNYLNVLLSMDSNNISRQHNSRK